MKTKIYSILAGLLLTTSLFAQAPQTMTYQAVVRDSNNALVESSPIGIRVSILIGSVTGTAVYVETHTTQTNQNGLFDIVIGGGTIVSGNYYTDIYWPSYQYFLKTEIDPLGGNAYTITSTSALLSVPYSNYSLYSGSSQYSNYANYAQRSGVHYLGETFNGGIIYYLYKDSVGIEHGLIVALTESSAAWQTTPLVTNANRTDDGAFNTALLGLSPDLLGNDPILLANSPAATYIASLGAGWYLPSIDELMLLHHNRFIVQKALRNGLHTQLVGINENEENLSYGYAYWSSTIAKTLYDPLNNVDMYFSWAFDFNRGLYQNNSRTFPFLVRGVRAF